MLDLDAIDVAKIAGALADQTDYEHRWLIGPRTGELAFWTSDLGIDGEDPVELDELDLILIDPLPSNVWYQDMVDFGDGISDRGAGERQSRSLEGKGAFRRFKNQLYQRHPELIADWHALRDARATVRAVPWLADEGLIEEDAAERFSDTTARPPGRDAARCGVRPYPRRSTLRLSAARRPCGRRRHAVDDDGCFIAARNVPQHDWPPARRA